MISEHYREQNRQLHAQLDNYGAGSARYLGDILYLCEVGRHKTILDYGCGKGTLVRAMKEEGLDAKGYDPAVDEYLDRPGPADLVVCTDVLEHVEPEHLDAVLDDLAALTRKVLFVIVSTVPAKKTLPDGRNAHLSLKSSDEWRGDLEKRFRVAMMRVKERGFMAVLLK